MVTFGKRSGGGRRLAKRESAPLSARLETISRHFRTVLVDISATGARVQGAELPAVQEQLYFSAGGLRTVATVKWRSDLDCGVQFCEPLLQKQVIAIRHEVASNAGLPPEMRAALEDWVVGLAR
jgi:hypothetical protein